MGSSSPTDNEHDNETDSLRRFEDRMTIVWSLAVYGTVALGVWSYSLGPDPWPSGWRLIGMVALLVAFFLLYHLVYLPSGDDPPVRLSLVYGLAVAVIYVLLMTFYSVAFVGVGIAIVCQLLAVLPVRYWAVPVAGVMVIVAVIFNVWELIRDDEGGVVALLGFQVVVYLVAFGTIVIALRQRWRLATLVEELRTAQAALRRTAAQADELAVLRERTRLAREMHDSLGHSLVLVNVRLEVVERLYARDPARGAAELRETRDLVRRAMGELRQSLDDLRGPVPPVRDLAVETQRLLTAMSERTSLVTAVETSAALPVLPPAMQDAVWAVLREALHNVERHAAAASVVVTLTATLTTMIVRVEDDGAGFDPTAPVPAGRHGLTGMHERIAALGGELTIRPRPGGGTLVEARVPLASAAAAPALATGREG